MQPALKLIGFAIAPLALSMPIAVLMGEWDGGAIAQENMNVQKKEADVLFEKGNQALEQGKYEQAIQLWEKALPLYRTVHDLDGEARVLLSLGTMYSSEPEKALGFFEKALSIFRSLHDRKLEALTLANLSSVYATQSQYDKAIQVAQQALLIARETGYKFVEKNALNNLSNSYFKSRQFKKAIELDLELLPMYYQAKDNYRVVRTLKRLSDSYYTTLEYEKAVLYSQKLIGVYRLDKDIENEVESLVRIGNIYREKLNLNQAILYYKKGLEVARKNQSIAEINALFELGNTALEINNYEQAVKYFEQVISYPKASSIVENFEDLSLSKPKESYIGSLAQLGSIYVRLGNYSKSLVYLEEASKLISTRTAVSDETFFTYSNLRLAIYQNLSIALSSVGKFDESIKTLEREIVVAQAFKDKRSEAYLLHTLGNAYYYKGKMLDARNKYLESLEMSKKYGLSGTQAAALSGLGNVSNSLDEAISFYQQSLMIHEENKDYADTVLLFNNLGNSFLKKGDFSQAEKYLRKAVDISKSLLEKLSDSQRISFCDVCEQSKQFLLLQLAQVAQNKFEAALQTSEIGRARAFHKAFIASLLKRGIQALGSNLQSSNVSITQIQQVAKVQNATLVQYSIADENLYIYIVQHNGDIQFRKVNISALGKSLNEFVNISRDGLGVRGRSNDADVLVALSPEKQQKLQEQRDRSLRQLHQLLIEPIADLLPKDPNQRVIFMPQGELFLVPFPALLNAQNQPLITQHTILTAPSIQTLDLTHKTAQSLPKRDRPALVVGNPTMPTISTVIGDPPTKLAALPGSETEAIAIAKQLNTQAIIGANARKNTIVKLMQTAGVIHLATHGLLDSFKGDTPGAIALAPNDPNGKGDRNDGLLTSGEIFDLKLNADLVVLSACDTGRGDITGDGVIGLSRSLFVAGVPSVIVSLWKVPDDSTALLMTEFYKNWKDLKLDKAQALRQAMLTTMKTHPNPRDWAAFTLIGEAE